MFTTPGVGRFRLEKWMNLSPRVRRLKMGDWSFGHGGRHRGDGITCPRELHHHHDQFCELPTVKELREAGINPQNFHANGR